MQLSPRQYQVDPTGSSYVADTRPLMAAMGAQAASQIEGNRMMQETVQRGMKGVEDFAARRQLAAARAQLGTLSIDDPEYGQKLSGLVMDNPLAFTNEKTAPIANFAFKQAANDFQSKRESEQRTALQAAEFNLRRDLANMETQSRMSLAGQDQAYQVNALIFGKQDAALQNEEESLRAQRLLIADPEGQALIDKKLNFISGKRNSLVQQMRQGSGVQTPSYGAAPLPDDNAPLPTDLGNAAIYGAGNLGPEFIPEEGQTFGNAAPSDVMSASLFPAPNAPIIQGTNAPVATPVFDPSFTPEVPPPAEGPFMGQIPMRPETPVAAPAAPAAQVTPSGLTLEEEQKLNSIFSQTAAAKAKKKDEGLSASDYKDDEKFTDDLSYSDPDIRKVTNELEELKSREEALKTIIDKSKIGATPDQEAQYAAAVLERSKKQTEVDRSKANFRTAVRIAGGPEKYLAIKLEQEKAAREEALKAQSTPAAPAAATPATGAGTAAATPKPPAPPVSADPYEQAAIDIELKRKAEQGSVVPDTNKQWTDAKQKVANILGGPQELMKIADEVYQNNVLGVSLPADETRLRAQLKLKIINKAGNIVGFNQKAERLGLQTVSRSDVIEALVDDIIRARQSGTEKANAATIAPLPNQDVPAVGNSTVIPKR